MEGSSSPGQRFRPFGIRDLCKKLGKSMGPLPRKMHVCIHMYSLGDNFRRCLDPLKSMIPWGPRLVCFGRGAPRGTGITSLLPKITLLSHWSTRTWGTAEAQARGEGRKKPSGCEKEP